MSIIMSKREERLNYLYTLGKLSKVTYWAEREFGWRPILNKDNGREAWYQYLLLGCFDNSYRYPDDYPDEKLRGQPIQKFAWRVGRQCLPEDSIIHDRDGSLLRIQDHPNAWKTFDSKEVFEVKVEGGYAVRCTGNHPIMTSTGWVYAEQLQRGSLVEVMDSWDKFGDGKINYSFEKFVNKHRTDTCSGNFELNDELAELLGWLTADGYIKKGQSLKFTNVNENYLARVNYIVTKYFSDIVVKKYPKGNAFDLLFTTPNNHSGQNSLKDFIQIADFDFTGFPKCLNKANKSQVAAFFRGMFGGDGCIYIKKNNKIEISLSCGNERTYAEFFRELLNKLGIHGQIKEEWMKKSTKPFFRIVAMGKQNALKFKETIGDIIDKPIPECVYKIKYVKKPTFVVENSDNENINYRRVLSVISIGNYPVWDVEFAGKGWFFSGGVRVSNSGKTESLAIGALFLALCRPIHFAKLRRYKDHALIGTPRPDGSINESGWTEAQDPYMRGAKIIIGSADADKARTIFDRVMKFIDISPKLSKAMEDGAIIKKLHPFPELIFKIKGWTEDASITFRGPGAGGQTARSKTFDYKLYDEADWMPSIFFEAEKATSINAGVNSLVILSSTPTGKREHFYNACFALDTPIVMANGEYKPIKDIEVDDLVYNRYGVIEPVTAVMKRKAVESLVSFMTTYNDTTVTCTSRHRFMSVRKYERYCSGCQQFVWRNRTKCVLHKLHHGLKPVVPKYHSISDLQAGDYLAIPLQLVENPKKAASASFGAIDDKFLYVPIKQYKKIPSVEGGTAVCNLTVGQDHSYCVNGYGVANCTNPAWNYQEFHIPSKENPNFTPEFNQEFINEHPQAVYQHEIEADWGTVEEGVFDWTYFGWVFRLYDEKPNPKDAEHPIRTPIYRVFDTSFGRKRKPFPDEYERINLTPSDIGRIGHNNLGIWLRAKFPGKIDNRRYWFGADFGYQSDPSEFVVFEEWNGVMKMILRIHMQHIPYLTQCDIIALLDNFYLFAALGMDQGSNGLMVEQVLKAKELGHNKFKNHNFEKRLYAVNFSNKVQVSNKFNNEKVLVPVKQFMTDSIIMAAQNRLVIMPGVDVDEDLENQFRNHTYTTGANGTIIYSKSTVFPDHIVDAVRTAFFAKSQVRMPTNRAWPVGSAFKVAGGRGGYR